MSHDRSQPAMILNLVPSVVFGFQLSLAEDGTADEVAVNFARDVRPVLANHEFQCHGPDDESCKADLRLDTQDGFYSVLDTDDLTRRLPTLSYQYCQLQ